MTSKILLYLQASKHNTNKGKNKITPLQVLKITAVKILWKHALKLNRRKCLIKYTHTWIPFLRNESTHSSRNIGTEKIENVRSFCRQKEKEVIICGRAHLPNKDPPFSGIRFVLSILLDSANGSGSPARGMFGYFTFIFISSAFAAAGGRAKLRKQGTQPAAALLDLSHIKIITATLLYYIFRFATLVVAVHVSLTFCSFPIGDTVLPAKKNCPKSVAKYLQTPHYYVNYRVY